MDQSVIHQFLTIEKFRCRTPAYPSAAPSIADVAAFMLQQRRASPLNYVVEVLSVATLKILDQTYKTCKGKSRARDGHRKSVFRCATTNNMFAARTRTARRSSSAAVVGSGHPLS